LLRRRSFANAIIHGNKGATMSQQVNQQFVIDELIRRINSLTIETVILSAQLREMQMVAQNHTHEEEIQPPFN
jgi:hypothetical protein